MLRVDRTLRIAVNADLARLQARAIDIVRAHREALDAIAAALADRRHLTGEEVRTIFEAKAPRSTIVRRPDLTAAPPLRGGVEQG
jgi:cell division protease FtsH